MKAALLSFFFCVSATFAGSQQTDVTMTVSQKNTDDLQLIGILQTSHEVCIFVSWNSSTPRLLNKVGSLIGPYRWTAVGVKQGYADFVSDSGTARRVWLPEGSVKNGSQDNNSVLVSLPPLESLKGLIGLDEALARRPDARAHIEKRVLYALNKKLQDEKVPWEDRSQALADLMTGKGKMFLVPENGVDDAFAKKYGMTPEEVKHANWGSEIGEEFKRTRSTPAKN